MRFMVMVRATTDSEAGVLPDEKLLAEMGKYNEELVKAGVMLAGEGLQPSSKGARVRFSGNKRTVIDGPFAETKELIAGFWLWQVKSQGRGDRLAQALPESLPRRRIGSRASPDLRGGRLRCRVHARAARAGGAPARAGGGAQIRGDAMLVQPYLFFEGRCEEAAEFYRRARRRRSDDADAQQGRPEPPPPGTLPPGSENKVMHMSLKIGDTTVLASDGHCSGKPNFQGFSLSLTVRDDAEAERTFAALADGGQVRMPLGKTFFSSRASACSPTASACRGWSTSRLRREHARRAGSRAGLPPQRASSRA